MRVTVAPAPVSRSASHWAFVFAISPASTSSPTVSTATSIGGPEAPPGQKPTVAGTAAETRTERLRVSGDGFEGV